MRGLGARAPVPLLLLVTMLFWGAAFNVTEVALDHTTPAFTAFARGAFGFLLPSIAAQTPAPGAPAQPAERSRWPNDTASGPRYCCWSLPLRSARA